MQKYTKIFLTFSRHINAFQYVTSSSMRRFLIVTTLVCKIIQQLSMNEIFHTKNVIMASSLVIFNQWRHSCYYRIHPIVLPL